MALPDLDFDPSEAGVTWKILKSAGHRIFFATPTGQMGQADPRMVSGDGLSVLKPLLMADANGLTAYQAMVGDAEFQHPLRYSQLKSEDFDALVLPGGHAKGMRAYLESSILQGMVADFFRTNRPVGAICHGVVLVARSRIDGKSVLFGRKTTALTKLQEYTAYNLTRLWLQDYYLTYPTSVEDEVKAALKDKRDFQHGPIPLGRDSPGNLSLGFTVHDGNYLSARWPGDAHRFGADFEKMLA